MTNQELSDRLCSATGPISVSMSRDGIFLTIEGTSEAIDFKQAEIVWLVLPELMKVRAAVGEGATK